MILVSFQGFAQTNFNTKLWAKIPQGKVFVEKSIGIRYHCKRSAVVDVYDPVCEGLNDVNEFYISKYEISTSDYLQFLNEISLNQKSMFSPKVEKNKINVGWGESGLQIFDFQKKYTGVHT